MQAEFDALVSGIAKAGNAPFYTESNAALFNADCFEILPLLPENSIDLIFADPPYLLSNNGLTCQNGKMVSVNKGEWDKSESFATDTEFHDRWIQSCRRVLKDEGSIWISGTYHNIYQCGYLLQKNNFHILNDIAWFKPNAAPNLSCRFFTASHETLLWARKGKTAKHIFNYEDMKHGSFPEDALKKPDTQMRSVWSIPVPRHREKAFEKHPTQKPLALVLRALKASTNDGAIILDPFNGSGTTGVASDVLGNRFYIGVELEQAYCAVTEQRLGQARD